MMNEIDLHRVDLNLLALFEVIWQERHVGRAAARLHRTPSAVSHGLARLRTLLHDPLFIRHPRGLNPTERAMTLAGPVADILERVRGVVAASDPFAPARSRREFVIAAVDGIGSVILPDLIASVRRSAPHVTLRVRAMFPDEMAGMLDRREADLALAPLLDLPQRFMATPLYEEEFVVAARRGHPLLARPTLKGYLSASHLLVGTGTDTTGFIDQLLAADGMHRTVQVTAPGFMWALAVLAESDLVGAIPRRLVERHGARQGVDFAPLPLSRPPDRIAAITVRAAMGDAGLQWLLQRVTEAAGQPCAAAAAPRPRRARKSASQRQFAFRLQKSTLRR